MKSDKGFHMDFSKFEEDFKRITEKAVPKAAGKGMFEAGNELLRDAIKIKPYAPFDKGDLRASARVDKAVLKKDSIEIDSGFNIEYAGKWHEIEPTKATTINWSLPGSGPKYLETKMSMFKNKYMQIVAKFIRQSAK